MENIYIITKIHYKRHINYFNSKKKRYNQFIFINYNLYTSIIRIIEINSKKILNYLEYLSSNFNQSLAFWRQNIKKI